jgi:hypothetical protein
MVCSATETKVIHHQDAVETQRKMLYLNRAGLWVDNEWILTKLQDSGDVYS